MTAASGSMWANVYDTPYSNQYNTAANAFLLSLISLSLLACLAISWRTQRCIPFSFLLCIACIFEIAAYALRFEDWALMTFTTNVGLSTISPIFLTIGIHLSTAQVLTTLGVEHAPLSPNAHLRIFIWADILAALLQGTGLGLIFSNALPAADKWGIILPPQATAGTAVLSAGLFLQTLSLAGALACLSATYIRAGRSDRKYGYTTFHRDGVGYVPLSPRFKVFLAVLPLAAACVLVRCAYRTAAAWGGLLDSDTARDALLWLVAEGVLLTEAMVTLAVFHPAVWLEDETHGRRSQHHHHDVEETGGLKGGRSSIFSGIGGGKRLSSATTLTAADIEERQKRDSRANLNEVSQLLFQTNLIAPSDAGSSTPSGSRRGSAGSHDHDHDHDHDNELRRNHPLYDASPYDVRDGRYSEDITAESRVMSPLEAEAEEDRISIAPEVPRKSSKRISRVLAPDTRVEAEEEEEEDDDDRLDIESVVLPRRKPSRRETTDDTMEDVALTSTYSQSVYSQ